MSPLRRLLFTGLCIVTLAAVWWGRHAEGNDSRAYVAQEGGVYRVEMKGWRFPLVHDPGSFLLGRTYEATVTIELPRLEGVIEGTEIAVGPERRRYPGRVTITNRTMHVDLTVDDGSPLSWNGEYTLVRRDTVRVP